MIRRLSIRSTICSTLPSQSNYWRKRRLSLLYTRTSITTTTASATRSVSSTTPTATTGLFSIPELQTPHDFSIVTQQAIQQCNTIRSSLAAIVAAKSNHIITTTASSSPPSNEVVVSTLEEASDVLCQLDDISKIVCNVIDAAELCRSVHSDAAWRTMAQESFVQLSDYLSILNADTTLYDASRLVSNTQHPHLSSSSSSSSSNYNNIWNALCEEERRFVQLLQAEFVRDGIHLSYDVRMKVRDIQNQLVQIESRFLQNITHSRDLFTIKDSHVSAVTDVIPLHILQQHGGIVEGTARCHLNSGTLTPATMIQIGNTDSQILQTLLRYSSDANLRQQIYYESMTSVSENVSVLQDMIQVRHELATTQNFHSYVERNLLDKMIGTSSADVLQFLNIATQQNEAAFKNDMTVLSKTKQQMEGNAKLEPWDIQYYTGLIKSQYHQDLSHNVSQYLSVSNCINAMQLLVHELFGITMQEESLSSIEQWDVNDTNSSSYTTTKLRKYQFTGPDARPLGTMYLDLHPRDNKYSHAAHFTVRCGCEKSPNIRQRNSDMNTNDDQYQYPIIALVCNLSDSAALSHGEVETLFHEFGHALHSLLSRTKFQHVAGTRTALDFVETPSHLFENFVWDTQFLQVLGRHHSTGEVMPMNLIQQIQQSRYQLASIERQNQILYSFFDQKIFGAPIGESTTSPTQLFGELHKQLNVPYAKDTHWYTRFGHLVSYGGGYYAYLYSQVFARDIWTQCFEQRSFDRTVGNQLWQKVLRYGGAKDPHVMLTDLLGRTPKVNFTS